MPHSQHHIETCKQVCNAKNGHCPKNINRHFQFIRPCYCPTTYFNRTNPDPYTYLGYWRRRMCHLNYMQYMGVLPSNVNSWPNPNLTKCPTTFYNRPNHAQLPYLSGGNLCETYTY